MPSGTVSRLHPGVSVVTRLERMPWKDCFRGSVIRVRSSAAAVLAALLIYAGGFSTTTLIGVLIIAVAFRTGWQKLAANGDE